MSTGFFNVRYYDEADEPTVTEDCETPKEHEALVSKLGLEFEDRGGGLKVEIKEKEINNEEELIEAFVLAIEVCDKHNSDGKVRRIRFTSKKMKEIVIDTIGEPTYKPPVTRMLSFTSGRVTPQTSRGKLGPFEVAGFFTDGSSMDWIDIRRDS